MKTIEINENVRGTEKWVKEQIERMDLFIGSEGKNHPVLYWQDPNFKFNKSVLIMPVKTDNTHFKYNDEMKMSVKKWEYLFDTKFLTPKAIKVYEDFIASIFKVFQKYLETH